MPPDETDPFDVSFGGHPPGCSCDECAADSAVFEAAQDAHRAASGFDEIDDDADNSGDLGGEDDADLWWDEP